MKPPISFEKTASRREQCWRTAFAVALGLIAISAVAIFLNRETYAIGDDYHVFSAYFAIRYRGYFDALERFLTSPFAAGRPIAIAIDLIGLSLIGSIRDLYWVRLLHLALLSGIFLLFGEIARKAGLNTVISFAVALAMFLLPGIWHLYMVTYGTGMLAGVTFALLVSYLTMRRLSFSYRDLVVIILLAILAIYSYQPIWPLLFLGINTQFLTLLTSRKFASRTILESEFFLKIDLYCKLLFIVTTLLLLNFLMVRYGYESPRLQLGIRLGERLQFAVVHLVPMTIYPLLYFWFRAQSWLILVSWMTVGGFTLFFSAMIIRLIKSLAGGAPAFSYIGWRGFTVLVLIATALLPLSLGMYFFTDQAFTFRRVTFASMFFWFTVLVTAFLFLQRLRQRHYNFVQLGFIVVVVGMLAGVAAIMDLSTQQVAAREWFAAICASKIASLSEPARVSRTEALKAVPLPFPHALRSDELQVRTLFYPSGAMLIWLSHLESSGSSRPSFSPWKLQFTDELTSNDWNRAFAECSTRYKNEAPLDR